MGQKHSPDREHENPFRNPIVRWGITIFSAAAIAGVAFVSPLPRVIRLILFGIAVLELIFVPWVLKNTN